MSTESASTREEHPMERVWTQRRLIDDLLYKCDSKDEAEAIGRTLLSEEKNDVPLSAEQVDRSLRRFAAFGLKDLVDRCVQYAKNEEKTGHVLGDRVVQSAMDAYGQLGFHREGKELFDEYRERDDTAAVTSPRLYLAMLRSCAQAHDSKTAETLLDEIHQHYRHVRTLESLVDATEEDSESARVTEDSDSARVTEENDDGRPVIFPRALLRAYNLALRSCASGDETLLERIEAKRKENGVAPDDETYNAVVATRAAAKNAREVIATTKALYERPKARFDRHTLKCTVRAASETGDWEFALRAEHTMRKLAMPADNEIVVECMKLCNDAGQWNETVLHFERMQRRVRPPAEAYRLVRVACVEGKFATQAKLWGLFDDE